MSLKVRRALGVHTTTPSGHCKEGIVFRSGCLAQRRSASSPLWLQRRCWHLHGDLLSQDAGHILRGNYDRLLQDAKPPAALKHFCVDSYFLSAGNQFLMTSVQNIAAAVLKKWNKTCKSERKQQRAGRQEPEGLEAGLVGTREELAVGRAGQTGPRSGGGSWVDWPQPPGPTALWPPSALTQDSPGNRGCFLSSSQHRSQGCGGQSSAVWLQVCLCRSGPRRDSGQSARPV